MLIWLSTIGVNLFLCCLMLYRGHAGKYRVLFSSLIWQVMAAPVLYFIYRHYGGDSAQYGEAWRTKNFIDIVWDFGTIFEAWRWRNRCVRVPQEIYLFSLLVVFVAKKAQFIGISNAINEVLRYSNLIITLWWCKCFSQEMNNERREFRQAPRPSSPPRASHEE